MEIVVSDIKKSLGHKLIASKYAQKIIIETIQLLPLDLIKFVTKNCWFVSSFEDGWAFVLKGSEIKKSEYLIFLSDELMQESESQIRYTILHELGHVVLGHRNSIATRQAPLIGEVQSKAEVRRQEKEADEFAKKYYN